MYQKFTILAIDPDRPARERLEAALRGEGFRVVVANDGLSGLRAAYENHPDAVLLDAALPDMDGLEVCRRLRELTALPILFVTARAAIDDILHGFHAGADDYLIKPFDPEELVCRLLAAMRRAGTRTNGKTRAVFPSRSVMLDLESHDLVTGGRTVHLTPLEFQVLGLLVRHAGRVLSPDAILTRVWGPQLIGEPNLVKQYIYRLRSKIEPDPARPVYLHTVRGTGYYFESADVAPPLAA
jgi:DNA-binding response OmpR family regulator